MMALAFALSEISVPSQVLEAMVASRRCLRLGLGVLCVGGAVTLERNSAGSFLGLAVRHVGHPKGQVRHYRN